MTLVSSVQLTKSVELVVGLVKNDWIHGVVATHSPPNPPVGHVETEFARCELLPGAWAVARLVAVVGRIQIHSSRIALPHVHVGVCHADAGHNWISGLTPGHETEQQQQSHRVVAHIYYQSG